MRILFILFIMCIYSLLWAQDVEKKVIIKKSGDQQENVWISDKGEKHVVEKKKTVTVDVSKEGKSDRKVKIVTGEDGEQKVIEWMDKGTIPDDIQRQLDEEGIDIDMLNGGNEMEVTIDDREDIIEIEWDGQGEMPAELMKLKDEHDIDIEEYIEGENGEKKIIMIKKRSISEGPHKIHKSVIKDQKFKMITIDDKGNENVIEWNGDGDMPEELMEHLGEEDIVFHKGRSKQIERNKGGERHMIFMSDDGEIHEMGAHKKRSNTYMGAQIESTNMGVKVVEIMKDSPADKAKLQKGDVIQKINGARTRSSEDLLDLLNYFEPNDKVELTVLRDGKEKKLTMNLGQRPDNFR
jgi:hypothetical protein